MSYYVREKFEVQKRHTNVRLSSLSGDTATTWDSATKRPPRHDRRACWRSYRWAVLSSIGGFRSVRGAVTAEPAALRSPGVSGTLLSSAIAFPRSNIRPNSAPCNCNVAVLSHAEYVPTLTAAAALRVKAALSKAAL